MKNAEKILDNIERLHGVRAKNTFTKLLQQELDHYKQTSENIFSPQQVRAVYFTAGLLLHDKNRKVKDYDPTTKSQLNLPFM